MNPKQTAFVKEYAIDHNATQAAIRAGYSERTARQIGQQLLTKVDISEAVGKTQEAHAERCNVTVDSITVELEEGRQAALLSNQASAMVSATMGKAKLHGLITEKHEDVTKRSRDEKLARATELTERLGISGRGGLHGDSTGGQSESKPN
tara:strand:- start:256 stop:705 length:450 start_codon:yes stop_codon:yes gene_type:complete